jgi:hypothetical protein
MQGIRRLAAAPAAPEGTVDPNTVRAARLRFAYWNERYVLRLLATARQRELSVAVASLVDVGRTGLTLRSKLTAEPRYAPLFDVTLEIPREWTIVSVQAAGKPVAWEVTDEMPAEQVAAAATAQPPAGPAMQFVRFDLDQVVQPGSTVTVELVAELQPPRWLEPEGESSSVLMPAVRLIGASEVEGTLIVEAPRELEMRSIEVSPDLEPTAPPAGPAASGVGTALAYRHQDDAVVSGRIEARVKPAQISVETLTFASLARESFALHYQAEIQISSGQARSIDFTLPASVGEKIQVVPVNQSVRVIEQQHTTLPAGPDATEDQFLWHIVFDRPVTGQFVLTISFELPHGNQEMPGDEGSTGAAKTGNVQDANGTASPSGRVQRAPVPVLAFRNVVRQTGYIAVEAATDQEVEQQSQNLREVDPADLPVPTAHKPGRIVAAYQYLRLPFRLLLSGERRDSQEVLASVCDRATITSILSRQGIMRHSAQYQIRSLGVQHFTFQLPPGAVLWSVTLNGSPIEVRRSGGTNIVPLPAGGANRGAGVHAVEFLYETRVSSVAEPPSKAVDPQGTKTAATAARSASSNAASRETATLTRLLPQTVRETAPVVNMTVLKFDWNVHLPDGTLLVSSAGDFKPIAKPTRSSLLAWLGSEIAANSVKGLGVKFTLLGGAVVFGGIMWLFAQSRGFLPAVLTVAGIAAVVAVLVPMFRTTLSTGLSAPKSAVANNFKQVGMPTESAADSAMKRSGGGMPQLNYSATPDDSIAAGAELRDNDARMRAMPGDNGARAAMDMDALRSTLSAHPAPSREMPPVPPAAPDASTWAAPTAMGMASGGTAAAHPGGASAPVTAPLATTTPIQGAYRELARLSLTMNLDAAGRAAVGFTSKGRSARELIMHVQDDSLARGLQWVVIVAVAMLGWMMRTRAWSVRAGFVALCILVPVGLSGVLPLSWTLVLDALFIGGGIALVLWLVHALVRKVWSHSVNWTARGTQPATRSAVGSALILLAIAAVSDDASAQTDKSASKAKSAASKKADVTRTIAQLQVPQGELLDKTPVPVDSKTITLYVPYDPKKGDPRDSRWVYVPYDTFQRLWKLANPDAPAEPLPDVAATVAEVGFEGRLDEDAARFDCRVVVYTFEDKWTRVPLPFGRVALESIEVDGQPATVEELSDEPPAGAAPKPHVAAHAAGSRLAIYLEKAGLHVVDLRFSVPAARLGATGRITLPLRAAAAGHLRFELPSPELDVQIEGATGGWRIEAPQAGPANQEPDTDRISALDADEEATENGHHSNTTHIQQVAAKNPSVSVPIGGAGDLTIRWQPRRGDAPATRLLSADQTIFVDIKDSGIHLRSKLHYRVAQGSVRKLQLRVPPQIGIRSVSGADVADWSLVQNVQGGAERDAGELDGLRLEIALKSEVRTGTDIEIDTFLLGRESLGVVSVQSVEPLGVVRETGRIAIGCTDQFHVRVGATSELAQIERESVAVPGVGDAACELLSAYRYTARPWKLDLFVDRVSPKVQVAGHTAVAVVGDRATMHASIEMTIGDSPLGSFRLQLPAGLRLSRVTVPAGGDWFVRRTSDSAELVIEMAQPSVGKVAVEIIGTLALDRTESRFRVPIVSVTDASVSTGQIAVVLDQDTDGYQVDAGGAQPIAPKQLTGPLQALSSAPRVFAFHYNALPNGLTLGLTGAASQLAADVLSTVSVREGSVAYLSELGFEIRGAARSELQFSTPEWLGSDIDIQVSGIRQIQSQAEPAGLRTWTVTLQQPARGRLTIRLVQSLPLPTDGMVQAAFVQPLNTDPVRSFVILENRSQSQLSQATAQDVSPIEPNEIPIAVSMELRRRAISAHKMSNAQPTLSWKREQHEQEKAIAASINLADLITVIHYDGTYRTQAAYVVTNRTQQFLELLLPRGSELWAVHVAGQPVRPAISRRAQRDVTLVPLQKLSVGDISTQVVLIFTGNLGGPLHRWDTVTPPAPEILGNVPVARTLWTVYLPDDYTGRMVERNSNMTEVAAGDLVVARNLSFLDEMKELVNVYKFSPSRNSNILAFGNLKQISSALPSLQRPASNETPAFNDNRQIWRRADPNIMSQQLESFLSPTNRPDGAIQVGEVKAKDDWSVVQQRARELQSEIATIIADQPADSARQQQLDLPNHYFNEPDVTKQDQSILNQGLKELGAAKSPAKPGETEMGEGQGGREARRGKLIEQNFANLDKLKDEQAKTRALMLSEESKDSVAALRNGRAVTGLAGGLTTAPAPGQAGQQGSEVAVGGAGAPDQSDAAARSGVQSIDIEIPVSGKPYHYMRLLGDPKLSLAARDQEVTRWTAGAAWALLCVTLAGLIAYLAANSQAHTWARIGWPWLAIAIGCTWLFLLPIGYAGCILIVVGASVLAWRTRVRVLVPTGTKG